MDGDHPTDHTYVEPVNSEREKCLNCHGPMLETWTCIRCDHTVLPSDYSAVPTLLVTNLINATTDLLRIEKREGHSLPALRHALTALLEAL